MSDPSPEASGTAAAPAGDGPPVTAADILVDSTSGEAAGAATGESASTAAAAETPPADAQDATLNLADVFPGADLTDPNLGAYLKVETVDGNTVVSLDADGAGEAAPVTVVTLEGITGVTLQQLLNNGQDIT